MYELKQKRKMTMFYNLLAKTNNTTLVLLVPMLCSFLIAFFSLKFFKRILPKDQGRAFAVNGALSEGKPRGAGIIFVTSFTLSRYREHNLSRACVCRHAQRIF